MPLQRDYLLELIQRFCKTMTVLLKRCCIDHDPEAISEAEGAIAEILDLDRETALSLSPASLVTMMLLSGTSDSVAGYVSYSLLRLSEAYSYLGENDLAVIRHDQAVAVAHEFQWDLADVPEGLEDIDHELQEAAAQND